MSELADPKAIIDEYTAAYTAANPGNPIPAITYERGWYVMRSDRSLGIPTRYRRWQLQRFTKTLQHRAPAAPSDIGR